MLLKEIKENFADDYIYLFGKTFKPFGFVWWMHKVFCGIFAVTWFFVIYLMVWLLGGAI